MRNRFGKEQNITPFIELKHFSGSIKSIKESLHVLIISGKKKNYKNSLLSGFYNKQLEKILL